MALALKLHLIGNVFVIVLKDVFSELQTVVTGDAEEAPPAEETDAQPVKRAAEEEVGSQFKRLLYVFTNL